MKIKEILKRSYYALTSGALLYAFTTILDLCFVPFGHTPYAFFHPIRYPIIITVFTLLFCWVMSRHNKRDGAILISVVTATMVIGLIFHAFIPFIWYGSGGIDVNWFTIRSINLALQFICVACMMVAGFLSGTKYHNILPDQSITLSKAFRIIIWIGQVMVLLLAILHVVRSVGFWLTNFHEAI